MVKYNNLKLYEILIKWQVVYNLKQKKIHSYKI